jgi:glycerol-3-phosphate dehydrogenase (NAD(P)+)
MRIGVIGAGSWGTAVSALLAKKGYQITLWAREEEVMEGINKEGRNPLYLTEIPLPESISSTLSLQEAAFGKDFLVIAVPSRWSREMMERIGGILGELPPVLNLAKGFDPETKDRLSRAILERLGEKIRGYAVLSGPNHAEEVIREIPSATVVASFDQRLAETLQKIFSTPYFRVYTSNDIKGVEVGGAYKNIIAIAAGVLDGMGLGDNTKASLITRGLAEMMRFGAALGANPITLTGLAGIGDLIVTCISRHSRNRGFGEKVGQGMSMEEATRGSAMVVEGISATQIALQIARSRSIDIPIAEVVHCVLFEGLPPREAMEMLMSRRPRKETDEELFPFINQGGQTNQQDASGKGGA